MKNDAFSVPAVFVGKGSRTTLPVPASPLLIDQFITTHAAPLGSRACEPGPGTLTFTDSASTMSISGGALLISGTPLTTDGWISSSSYTRAAGLGLFAQIPVVVNAAAANSKFGWVSTNAVNGSDVISVSTYQAGDVFTSGTALPGGLTGIIFNGLLVFDAAIILRGTGAWILIRSAGQDWKLGYVKNLVTTTPLWPRFRGPGSAINVQYDNVQVRQLPDPWNNDWGPVTQRIAVAAALATLTSKADLVLEATRTIVTNDLWDLYFRYTDANNYWFIRVDQAGGALSVYSVIAGVQSQAATVGAQTYTNGTSYRVLATIDGAKIQIFVNDASKLTYASMTANVTGTTCQTTLSCTDFAAWPRLLSGAALGVLSTYYPYGTGAVQTVYADNTLGSNTSKYNPATRSGTTGTSFGYTSLNGAIQAVSEGGTVIIRSGTYSELGSSSCCFPISKSLTINPFAGDAVTLTYPGGNPPLTSAGNYGPIISVSGSASVTIDGLASGGITIVGTHDLGSAPNQTDINWNWGSTGVFTGRYITFQKFGHACFKDPLDVVYGAGSVLEKCEFQAGGSSGLDHQIYDPVGGATYRYNSFTGSAGSAIQVYSVPTSPVSIYGNAIFSSGTGLIITSFAPHTIQNNTIYACTNNGILFFNSGPQSSNIIFRNNICYGNLGGASTGDINCDGVAISGNNNCIGIKAFTGGGIKGAYVGVADIGSNPLISNSTPSSFSDLRLQAGSPCIKAGVVITGLAVLDHTITSWPTPKAGSTSTNIGAFDS